MDLSYPAALPPDSTSDQQRLSLHVVFLLYRSRFWRWLSVTVPMSVMSALLLWAADRRIRAIFQSFPLTELTHHWGDLVWTSVIRYGSFFAAWFLGCFALAAIATIMSGLDDRQEDIAWQSDSFQRAREHLGGIVGVAAFTFCAFLLGMAAMFVVDSAITRLVGWPRVARYAQLEGIIGYVLVASVVSWFGMAIPLVIRRDVGPWPALKESLRVSNGYEVFLFLLVIESVVGSYVAWYASRYGLRMLFPTPLTYTVWYGWLVYVVSILASAAVQPPMFIGFSLLAEKKGAIGEEQGRLRRPSLDNRHRSDGDDLPTRSGMTVGWDDRDRAERHRSQSRHQTRGSF
jgi:hypothetical protein